MLGERRVVVTGLGCVSPVGNDVPSAWDSIVNGRSGIGPLTEMDPEKFATKIAGEIRLPNNMTAANANPVGGQIGLALGWIDASARPTFASTK